jgi:hypothetical protein
MIDLLVIVVFAAVTWCVASEGAWGAALVFLSVLFSGLLAMNFFEPLAAFLESTVSRSAFWRNQWDAISLVGLFALFVWLLRTATEHLSPTFIHLQPMLYGFSRWTCALLTGYVTTAFLLTALHTAALPREFAGFAPEPERRGPICRRATDFQWLGFTQYVSARSFRKGSRGHIFDGPGAPLPGQDDLDHLKGKVYPSFPIRYGFRRETGGKAAAPATGSGAAKQPTGSSSGGGTRPKF